MITVAELDEFLAQTVNGSPRKDQIEGLARLSGLQEGMLFHGLYDGQAGTYIQQFYCTLENLDENKFVKSWQNLISQHSILRSGFYHDVFSIPVQCIYKEAEMPVTRLDYGHLSSTEQENAIRDFEASDRLRGFDFTVLPLMRLCLIRLRDDYYHMIWSYIIIFFLDGWSLPIILEELLRAYESQVTETALTVLPHARYDDYIRYIYRKDKDLASSYWRKYMEGVSEGTLLSFISVAADRNKGKGVYKKEKLQLDSAFTAALMQFTHRNHITLNTLMQGVWAYLLHRYTGKSEVTYGVIVSGRPEDLPGVERGVGMYINTLPLHTAVDEDQSLTGWLQALQMNQLESREHQYTTLNEIQRLSEISGDIFDSLLVFENYPVSKVLNEQPWALRLENIGLHEHTNYPFNIVILATDTIQIDFGYNSSLLAPEYAASISAHFEQVLQQFIAIGQGLLSAVEILSDSERSLLLDVFNDNSDQYLQPPLTIIDAFNEQVILTPYYRKHGSCLWIGFIDLPRIGQAF
ncbi:condensation domain-containing protein [Pedobacter sp. NJ-S-72]